MAEFNVLGKVILGAVLMILGAVIIGVIADITYKQTSYTAVSSEVHTVGSTYATGHNTTDINPTVTYTLTNTPTGWRAGGECPISSFVLRNSSGQSFTLTTDYLVNLNAGTYTLVNSASALATLPDANNNTYATYKYCPVDYLNSSWGRSVLNLIGGFIAIMLIAAAVGIFYSVYQQVKE